MAHLTPHDLLRSSRARARHTNRVEDRNRATMAHVRASFPRSPVHGAKTNAGPLDDSRETACATELVLRAHAGFVMTRELRSVLMETRRIVHPSLAKLSSIVLLAALTPELAQAGLIGC